jgi:hypothetical protein
LKLDTYWKKEKREIKNKMEIRRLRAMEKCGLQGGNWEENFVGDWVSKDNIRHRTTAYTQLYILIKKSY